MSAEILDEPVVGDHSGVDPEAPSAPVGLERLHQVMHLVSLRL